MTQVRVSATPVADDTELSLIRLTLETVDADWMGQYDRLQVFRSTSSASGPWDELTDADWLPPALPKTGGPRPSSPVVGDSVDAVGATFEVLLNYTPKTITLTGTDPLTTAEVAEQIVDQSQGRLDSWVDAHGQLVIAGSFPGLQARLVLLPTDGAIIFGLPTTEPECEAVGKNPWLVLRQGRTRYELIDYYGSRRYYYRSRYIDSRTGAQSEPSAAFLAGGVGVPDESIITGYVSLVNAAGNPLRGEVRVQGEAVGSTIDGKVVAPTVHSRETDENGRAEFPLIRGQRVTVSVQGTNLVRTLDVPTDAGITSFNLFGNWAGPSDFFTVAVPELIAAERRS